MSLRLICGGKALGDPNRHPKRIHQRRNALLQSLVAYSNFLGQHTCGLSRADENPCQRISR